MLDIRTLTTLEGITVADVACRHGQGRGESGELATAHAVVFVRRGCFVRSADGVETVLDPTVAYCMSPGEEQRYDHPHAHGDDCTTLLLEPDVLAWLGVDRRLPSRVLRTSPSIDLEHRLLLACAGDRTDDHELGERAVSLVARALGQFEPHSESKRPGTERRHRALTDSVRESLAANPDQSLSDLATALAVSPHHLSRVFRAIEGHTIARHRIRLRVRSACDRLADGERNLARLAAEVGLVDQSHLCRIVRQETGRTPRALRAILAESGGS
jgi:AraC-like DNA-binding protein